MLMKSLTRLVPVGVLTLAIGAFILAGCTDATDPGQAKSGTDSETMTAQAVADDAYPLETCVVSGAKLGSMGSPVIYDYNGREVRFCCSSCIKDFETDPSKYMSKL